MVAGVRMGRWGLVGLGCRWEAYCCFQEEEKRQDLHEELVVVHQVVVHPCVEVVPVPWGGQ